MYYFDTRVGRFSIVRIGSQWLVMYRDESLGEYPSPQSAADDLTGGHCFSTPGNIATDRLGIPSDVSEWGRTPAS